MCVCMLGGCPRKQQKKASEARENVVILCTAASLMDSVCVACISASQKGGSAGKGCVSPICSLPLPCGREKPLDGSQSDP